MIILALGTNIEPREQYLKDALRKLEENNIKIILKSSVYETPAWGGVADQNFLNMCIHERNFVLAPLVEMYGDIEISGMNIKKSLEKITEPIRIFKSKL